MFPYYRLGGGKCQVGKIFLDDFFRVPIPKLLHTPVDIDLSSAMSYIIRE